MSKLTLFAAFFFILLSPINVLAEGDFNSIDNYYCPPLKGSEPAPINVSGRYVCRYRVEQSEGVFKIEEKDAIPRPPQLRVLEVWFVRVLYVMWGFSGIVFTGLLIWLGFKYMTSFGNEVAIAEVIKGFRKWLIGLALIFLSYPVLGTLFRILPIANTDCYSDIQMPGFQFFFPSICAEDPCIELIENAVAYEACRTNLE